MTFAITVGVDVGHFPNTFAVIVWSPFGVLWDHVWGHVFFSFVVANQTTCLIHVSIYFISAGMPLQGKGSLLFLHRLSNGGDVMHRCCCRPQAGYRLFAGTKSVKEVVGVTPQPHIMFECLVGSRDSKSQGLCKQKRKWNRTC